MNSIRAPLLGLALTAVIIIASCSLEPPGVPIWTVQGTVPFSERVYRMGELLTDSARMAERGWGIVLNPHDSTLQFELRDTINNQPIGDRITYEASQVETYSNRIDTIHIAEPHPNIDSINITEANPDLRAGYSGPVAPFVMRPIQDTLEFDVFNWVRVYRGWMRLSVTNQYPFPIENLTIRLNNLINGSQLGVMQFPHSIAPGATVIDSISLAGKLVQNQILMTANASSPGSANPVTILGNEKMILWFSISETEVESAEAHIKGQTFRESDNLDYENRNKIIRAKIKYGSAYFILHNTTRLRLFSTMIFQNITDSNGSPLFQNIVIEPEQSTGMLTLNLAGATINMTLNNQRLNVENIVTLEDTDSTRYQGRSYQTIAGWQGVDVEYWTSELTLSHFEGALDSIRIDIPEFITTVKFPAGLDSLNFTRDTLYLFIDNQTTIQMKANIDIRGTNSNTGKAHIISVVQDLSPGLSTIVVPNSDQLMSVIPDTISISGWAGLGRYYFPAAGYQVGEIDEQDGVLGTMLIKSALKFTIGETVISTDLTHLNEPLNLDIESVELGVHLTNSIPLYGTVRILMGNDSLAMDTVASVVIPRRAISNRRVVAAAETSYTLQMPYSSIQKMRRLPLFTQQMIHFLSNQGDTAWIYPDDSLAVQAFATVFYKIDPKGDNR